jgi:tetratricopeptide (TPR) repeat protein
LAAIAGVAGTLVQARSARQQRDFADRQLARAERINDLDRFLLTDAAPSGKLLAVNELLDRAEHIVERENYSNDAASHVELLISIGIQYYDRRDNNKSLGTLEEAYKLSRGLQEPSVRARAACALASPLTSGFEHVRAESLFQEGLRELPNDPQFALDRAFCLLRGCMVAMTTGAAQQAIDRVESADRVLKDSAFQSENLKLGVLQALGASYLMAARYRESIAAYEQAASQLSKLGYDDTRTAASLFHDWGLAVIEAGRPYEAEKIYRRGIEVSRTQQSEDAVTAALLVDYAGALRELGRLQEAADYAERAYVKAKQANDYPYLSSSLLQRTRIYRDQRDFTRAAAMLAELEPLVRNGLPAGHYGFALIDSERSLLAQSEGDLALALRLANQAVALDEATIKAGGQGAHLLPLLLIRRSAIELESHQPEAAASDATRALALLQGRATSGEFSEHTGRAYLALGRALLARGKIEEARAAARSAVEHLERTLGPDHVELRDAREIVNSSPQ